MNATPVIGVEFELLSVIVSVEVPPVAIWVGLNALATAGRASTISGVVPELALNL